MSQILIKNKGANNGEKEIEFDNAVNDIDVSYFKKDDTFHFLIDTDNKDNFISFDIDVEDLYKILKRELLNPND